MHNDTDDARRRAYIPLSLEELQALCNLLTTHLVKATHAGVDSHRVKSAIEYLFRRVLEVVRTGTMPEAIKPRDIHDNCRGKPDKDRKGDPDGPERVLMARLRHEFSEFFERNPIGQKQPYRVLLGRADYFPRFEPNHQSPQADDLVAQFWRPYRESHKATRIIYPEPTFFVDEKQTYFRNPDATTVEKKDEVFSYLADCIPGQLQTSYSFVPAGIVQAMLLLMASFREWAPERTITATPVLFGDIVRNDTENLIVLGTPTSTKMVQRLEHLPFEEPLLPMQTGAKHVVIYEGTPEMEEYADKAYPLGSDGSVEMVKWGVLTRRRPHSTDRVETLLAAKHGRAVEAMARFLTNTKQMVQLLARLGLQQGSSSGKEFPHFFQALFRVHMENTPNGPHIYDTLVEKAVLFDEPRSRAVTGPSASAP